VAVSSPLIGLPFWSSGVAMRWVVPPIGTPAVARAT